MMNSDIGPVHITHRPAKPKSRPLILDAAYCDVRESQGQDSGRVPFRSHATLPSPPIQRSAAPSLRSTASTSNFSRQTSIAVRRGRLGAASSTLSLRPATSTISNAACQSYYNFDFRFPSPGLIPATIHAKDIKSRRLPRWKSLGRLFAAHEHGHDKHKTAGRVAEIKRGHASSKATLSSTRSKRKGSRESNNLMDKSSRAPSRSDGNGRYKHEKRGPVQESSSLTRKKPSLPQSCSNNQKLVAPSSPRPRDVHQISGKVYTETPKLSNYQSAPSDCSEQGLPPPPPPKQLPGSPLAASPIVSSSSTIFESPEASTTPAQRSSSFPKLQVEIPDIELERYSVMFNGLLTSQSPDSEDSVTCTRSTVSTTAARTDSCTVSDRSADTSATSEQSISEPSILCQRKAIATDDQCDAAVIQEGCKKDSSSQRKPSNLIRPKSVSVIYLANDKSTLAGSTEKSSLSQSQQRQNNNGMRPPLPRSATDNDCIIPMSKFSTRPNARRTAHQSLRRPSHPSRTLGNVPSNDSSALTLQARPMHISKIFVDPDILPMKAGIPQGPCPRAESGEQASSHNRQERPSTQSGKGYATGSSKLSMDRHCPSASIMTTGHDKGQRLDSASNPPPIIRINTAPLVPSMSDFNFQLDSPASEEVASAVSLSDTDSPELNLPIQRFSQQSRDSLLPKPLQVRRVSSQSNTVYNARDLHAGRDPIISTCDRRMDRAVKRGIMPQPILPLLGDAFQIVGAERRSAVCELGEI